MDRNPCWIFVTEALKHDDIRNNSEIFRKAKQAEISGFSERSTWKIVDKKDFPSNANIVGARFANVLKNTGTANEIPKARYFAQGYKEKMKPFVVQSNPTLRQSFSKLIIHARHCWGSASVSLTSPKPTCKPKTNCPEKY